MDDLCKRLAQRIAVFWRIRRSLPLNQRKSYYKAMIKQAMLYASTMHVDSLLCRKHSESVQATETSSPCNSGCRHKSKQCETF